MSALAIRRVRREDLPRVWEMIHGLAAFEKLEDILTGSREALERGLFDEPVRIEGVVAERDGRLVGYALFHYTYSSFRTNPRHWLEDLYVEDAARGSGAGEALLAEVCRIALERGCHRLEWDVLDWNPARAFYERMGGRPADEGWTKYAMTADAMRRLAERDAR